MNLKFFIVTAKCGHVGQSKYIPIEFAIKAESMKEAASRVRNCPRVKHHHKDAILSIQVVDQETYTRTIEVNNADLYLKVQSSSEQKRLCEDIDDRILPETSGSEERDPWERAKRIGSMMRKRMIESQWMRGRYA